jgi:hypothetical protein
LGKRCCQIREQICEKRPGLLIEVLVGSLVTGVLFSLAIGVLLSLAIGLRFRLEERLHQRAENVEGMIGFGLIAKNYARHELETPFAPPTRVDVAGPAVIVVKIWNEDIGGWVSDQFEFIPWVRFGLRLEDSKHEQCSSNTSVHRFPGR